jgi:hypothetical protein
MASKLLKAVAKKAQDAAVAAAKRKGDKLPTPKQRKNKDTGNTSTAAPADPIRQERGRIGKKIQAKPQIQKAYDRIQAELKWLKDNGGAPESIAARTQTLKDMRVTHPVKPTAMKDVVAKRPTEAKPTTKTPEQKIMDIVANPGQKKTDMSIGGMATKNYVNPVKIVDNRKKKRNG